jgi:hypothetical protein
MTDTSQDPADAARRALDAAQAALDAAHEAEAALAARSDTAQAMGKTARFTALLAGSAMVAALALTLGGGLMWFKAAADMRDATEVQAAAAAAFVERLGAFNLALDRMDAAVLAAEGHAADADDTLDTLLARVDERLMALASAAEAASRPDAQPSAPIDQLRSDILVALAEVELSLTRTLGTVSIAPPPQTAAPAPAIPPAPAAAPRTRPAPRAEAPRAPATNPFRFP